MRSGPPRSRSRPPRRSATASPSGKASRYRPSMNAPAASLRRPLVEPRDLKALSARSDSTGLRHLAGHLTAIGCAMALVLAARHSWAVWPAMAGLGVLEVALFTPLHES